MREKMFGEIQCTGGASGLQRLLDAAKAAAGCSAVGHADFGQWWPWKQLQL
jgi:hypothetical protein